MKRSIPTPLELIELARARVYQASDKLDKSESYEQTASLVEELRTSIQNYLRVVPRHIIDNEDASLSALISNHDNIMGAWE